jgi:Uma2 family endonuclease
MGQASGIFDVVPEARRKPRPRRRMTYEQFLDWLDEETHAEWVDGEVVFMAPIHDDHSLVNGFLLSVVREFVHLKKLGKVFFEPFQMKTGPELPGRSPDLIFVSKRNLKRLHPTYLEGPADLAVEIISPGSRSLDRGDKFEEYEAGGVREYWIIDPKRKEADFFELGRDGRYRKMPLVDGVFRSRVLKGFWLREKWLWQSPQPTVSDVLREWKLL